MVVGGLFTLAKNIILFIFSFFNFTPISYDAVQSLYEVICYGTWVVGADLLAVVASNIVFWIGLRLTIGLIVFLWDFIPFV